MLLACGKPMPTIGLAPFSAKRRAACSRCAAFCTLEFEIGFAGLLLPALGALVGGLVERTVELAAEFVDDGRLGLQSNRRWPAPQAASSKRQHAHLRTWP
jgi:hypothetical protein